MSELLWTVGLPLGMWGPWGNPLFQTMMISYALPLIPFEILVALRKGIQSKDMKALASDGDEGEQKRPQLLSLQVLRVIGVAHVMAFHQIHEGYPLEAGMCAVNGHYGLPGMSSLCHFGMSGMYWVSFFFLLSGFGNAYQRMRPGAKKTVTDDKTEPLAWRRLMELYPQYFAAVMIGGLALAANIGSISAVLANPGSMTQLLKAATFTTPVTYPFDYGDTRGLSHLWYLGALFFYWLRSEEWTEFMRGLPQDSSLKVLLFCWLSTLAVPVADHFGLLVPSGSIAARMPGLGMERYLTYYHPVTSWMFFAGGIAVARLMEDMRPLIQRSLVAPGVPSKALQDLPPTNDPKTMMARLWYQALDGALTRSTWAVCKFGASASLAASFVVLPLMDWADPMNIMLPKMHAWLAFPGFAMVLFAAAQEQDVLLSLPAKLGYGSVVQTAGALATPVFLLHMPLHEIQWKLIPRLYWQASAYFMAAGSNSQIASQAMTVLMWMYNHGVAVHYPLVLGSSIALQAALPVKRLALPAPQDAHDDDEENIDPFLTRPVAT